MALPPADGPRVREIFEAALARPPAERDAYIATACGPDDLLRAEVERLLASHHRAENVLEMPAGALAAINRTAHLEGKRMGPYQLSSRLGAGGMGEVYKARDTRLDRTVAIKVLPAHVAHDPEARERFEREARAVAALNHPHICTLHDVGHHEGIDFLVMEYVEGETLAARLEKGPLPIAQALQYAIQMASALDKAHHAGIVHRDLKPGNIMLTKAGAKLLDFGLAKACAPLIAGGPAHVPATTDLTTPGTILGTVQYMAPEQLHGKEADARTDIFAFGAVLFEAVTGGKAFEGESPASLIGTILNTDPPTISARQPLAPPALDRIVSTCLAKDPDDRWQTARDLGREIQWLTAGTVATGRDAAGGALTRRGSWIVLGAFAAVTSIALAIAAAVWRTETPAAVRDLRFSVYPEYGSAFSTPPASVVTPQFALSPDGSNLAYVATSNGRAMVWVRPLNALTAQVLGGTEDATYPFWSGDGRSLGFFSQGKLKTVDLGGGAPIVRADASFDARGGTWTPDGTMLVSLVPNGGVSQVSADGSVQPLVPLERGAGEAAHRWPSFLPDGRHYLFHMLHGDIRQRGVYLAALGEQTTTRLVGGDWGAAAVDGYLLFPRGRTLMAQRLDVENRRVTGEPVPLLDNVGTTTTGYSAFSVSRLGTLVYSEPWPTRGALVWFSRDGHPVGDAIAPLADYVDFALSPDAGRLAMSRVDPQTNTPDIWLLDLGRGSTTRLTSDPMIDANTQWSPDGARIVFRSNRRGFVSLYGKPANGSRDEELIFEQSADENYFSFIPTDYAHDGAHVLFTATGRRSSFDVWMLSMGAQLRATVVRQTAFNEYQGVLSPDGRWIAYVSDETGGPQVYVQSFPKGEQRWQVSTHGGIEPEWRKDGHELYFLSTDRMLMAVSVSLRPAFNAGLPMSLFQTRVPVTANPYRRQYVAAPDGQRFLVNTAPENAPTPAIQVVSDWRALLTSRGK